MAHFKYMGERPRPGFVVKYGPAMQIRVPRNDGERIVLKAPSPAGFPIGKDVGYDFTDEMSLRYLRADTRFEEIV